MKLQMNYKSSSGDPESQYHFFHSNQVNSCGDIFYNNQKCYHVNIMVALEEKSKDHHSH